MGRVGNAGLDEGLAQRRRAVLQHGEDELAHVLREGGQRQVAHTVVGVGCGLSGGWSLLKGELEVEVGRNIPQPQQRTKIGTNNTFNLTKYFYIFFTVLRKNVV